MIYHLLLGRLLWQGSLDAGDWQRCFTLSGGKGTGDAGRTSQDARQGADITHVTTGKGNHDAKGRIVNQFSCMISWLMVGLTDSRGSETH